MKIHASLRSFALAGREAIARVGEQASALQVTIGPFSVTLYAPTTPYIAPAVAPIVNAKHECDAPSRCLVCRSGVKQ